MNSSYLAVNCGPENRSQSAVQGRERGAPSTHDHNRPDLVCSDVNVFTTSAVRVQHKVAVYVIVKASMQFVYTVAHFERVGAPVGEQALRVHMDRLLRQQQHLSYLRAKPSIPLRAVPLLLGGNAVKTT